MKLKIIRGRVYINYVKKMSDESDNIYKEIYGIKGYEINMKCEVRKKGEYKNEKWVKKKRGRKIYVCLEGEYYKPYILMLKTFNPYRLDVSEIDNYDKLNPNCIKFRDGDKYNFSLNNIGITKGGIKALKYGNKKIEDTHSSLVNEYWDFKTNYRRGISPDEISYGSNKVVSWKCGKGHTFEKSVRSFLRTGYCVECKLPYNVSVPHKILFKILNENFKDVRLEYKVDKYRVDIYIKDVNLCIEYDGGKWHRTKDRIRKDELKENCLIKELKCDIIRIREECCMSIESKGEVINHNYKEGVRDDFNSLKMIGYGIVKRYKESVVYLNDDEFLGLTNSIWGNMTNSLINSYPKLKEYYSKENIINFEELSYGVVTKVKWECPNCKDKWVEKVNNITRRKTKNYCKKCNKNKKENKNKGGFNGGNCLIIGKTDLEEMLKNCPSYTDLGKKLGVSGNTVRKRCRRLGIEENINYFKDEYYNNKGYSYEIYKRYLKLKNDKPDILSKVLMYYEKLSKNDIVNRKKLVGEGIYYAIGVIHNKKNTNKYINQYKKC